MFITLSLEFFILYFGSRIKMGYSVPSTKMAISKL